MDAEDLIDFDAPPRVDGLGGLRLPTFWVDKPASWFITAESRFRLHGVNREQTRYDFLVAALSKEAVSLILDVVENPPTHHPYTALKERCWSRTSSTITSVSRCCCGWSRWVVVSLRSCWRPCWNCVPGGTRPAFSLHTSSWSGCPLSCASC
jgi:hypothetical protein